MIPSSLFLDTLTLQGYTIFAVKGTLPDSRGLQGMDDRGKWLRVSPNKHRATTTRAATEEDEIAAAIRLSLGQSNNQQQQGAATNFHPTGYDEDVELAAAIAASLEHT